ncbi:hypothetical protein SEUCBS140593_008145 [Sporothrix eucalyptigena]|uniref:Integral membrane protein n=1 Tax=Sporothrix eucalyptigena TaxID=1812306 RepID=A0ABP0CKG9_9PEZI
MSYPYQNKPLQRRPVPGQTLQPTPQQAPPLQQQAQPTPPPAAPAYQQQQPQQAYPQQPQYQQQHLSPDVDQAPTLPPRPPGGAGPFLAQTYLSFPPPPRSPNRPPVLPPRPQASPQLQQAYQQQPPQAYAQHTYAQQPAYGQTQPTYAPAASPAPPGASSQATAPAAYQQGYYPPPPPPPLQQQQAAEAPTMSTYDPYASQAAQPTYDQAPPPQYTAPVHAPVAVDQKQPTGGTAPTPPPPPPAAASSASPTPAAAPAAANPDPTQQYATSYNYYEPPIYPTAAPAAPAAPQPAAAQATPTAQDQTPAEYAVSPATPASSIPAASAAPVSPEHTGDPMQQMNSLLQGMSIGCGGGPAELPATSGQERQTTPQQAPQAPPAQPTPPIQQTVPPQAIPTQQPPPPTPEPSAQLQPTAQPAPAPSPQPETRSGSDYPDPQYNHENYTPPNYAEARYANEQPKPADAPDPDAYRGAHVDPPFRPVISCIDNPMGFNTWWYTNPSAPDFYICSKCYMDYLYPTQFQNHFEVRYMRDGVKRHCRFKSPRITDQLLLDAVARGSLDGLVAYMNQRVAIPDCKKLDGAKGGQGLKWFRAKNDAIPGLVICEACFQDVACLSPFAYNFEPTPPHNNASETWACDLAVSFIRKEFDERSKTNDWPSFCNEAKARLGMQPCPKTTQVMISLRKWFTPVPGKGPEDAVLCAACYCDRVLKTGQEAFWQPMPHDPIFSKKYTSNCCAGMFNILMAFSAAEDNKDWPLFWRVLNRLAFHEKGCVPAGITDGNWYTLPSQPAGFNVCGGCHAGIIESLGLQQFFVPATRHQPAAGTAVVCSFNVTAPRFLAYVDKLLETWFTQDCANWESFAHRYANIPPCCRDTDYKGRAWYGWPECTICAECYLEFVQGTALDTSAMPLRPQIIGEARICEMYSPRMRALYKEACKAPTTGLPALLSYSMQRRTVYWQTMPICRNIVVQQKFTANMAMMARLQSVAYTGAGNLLSVTSNHHDHTYGQAGVGYGYDNMQQLAGARYNVQANQLSAQVGGGNISLVGQLESKWRSVE